MYNKELFEKYPYAFSHYDFTGEVCCEDNTNEPMFSYCVYEDGDYYDHHYNLTIYQREIM